MKHMKRSMFITTLIMTVVLVVALSTATFAWYTANTAVTATKTFVTSASSSTASLVIDYQAAGPNDTNTSVDLTMTNPQAENVPMVYASANAALPVVGTTTYADFVSKFVTFTRDAAGKFASTVNVATPDAISTVTGSGEESSTNLVLTNVGGASMASVSTTVTIEPFYAVSNIEVGTNISANTLYERNASNAYVYTTDETAQNGKTYYIAKNRDFLRVAVFVSDTSNGDYILKGIYGAGSTTQIANRTNLRGGEPEASIVTIGTTVINDAIKVQEDQNLVAKTFALTASGTSTQIKTNLASMGSIYVKVAVWFEGDSMLNADANNIAAFSMSFAS